MYINYSVVLYKKPKHIHSACNNGNNGKLSYQQ